MEALKLLAAALAAALAVAAPAVAQTQTASLQLTPKKIESQARWYAMSSVDLTPDGRHVIALVSPTGRESPAIAVWDANDLSKPPFQFGGGTRTSDFVQVSAIKNDRLFFVFRDTYEGPAGIELGDQPDFAVKTYITDLRGSFFQEPGRRQGTSRTAFQDFLRGALAAGNIVNSLPLDPDHVLLRRVEADAPEVLKFNVRDGSVTPVIRLSNNDGTPLFDVRTGEPYAKSRLDMNAAGGPSFVWEVRDASGNWVVQPPLTTTVRSPDTVFIMGKTEDEKLIVGHDLGSDHVKAYVYDPATQTFEDEVLFAHPNYSVLGAVIGDTAADAGKLLGFAIGGPAVEQYWIDPEMRAVHESLKSALPNRNVFIVDWTADRNRILVEVSASNAPPQWLLLDNKRQLRLIGGQHPDLNPDTMRPAEWVTYTARDGMEIPGALYLPLGWTKEMGPLPTVIIPHGGPWARDFLDWDGSGWPQFLATRGYAVLQPQYRGSNGLGKRLWRAGDEQWGLAMQDDKDDGAKWLIEQGIADPNRIAMFGYSYGGYAAFAASIRPNGLYQCAIAGAGVSDLDQIQTLFGRDRLARQAQGWTVKGLDPSERVADISIPLFIYHGNRDGRVPLFHGKDMYERAKAAGKTVEFLEIEDMPHSLPWWPEHHRQSLTAIEGWLRDDCGPGGL